MNCWMAGAEMNLQRHDPAACLEASDDMLARVLSPLGLDERLRLATVSKRWNRLLYSELRFPSWHAWRIPAVIRRVGSALRVLDISHVLADRDHIAKDRLPGLLSALGDGAGAELRTLNALSFTDNERTLWDYPLRDLPFFTPEQAFQLRASCPLLDASTRLAVKVR